MRKKEIWAQYRSKQRLERVSAREMPRLRKDAGILLEAIANGRPPEKACKRINARAAKLLAPYRLDEPNGLPLQRAS